jgi:hypothetical protein
MNIMETPSNESRRDFIRQSIFAASMLASYDPLSVDPQNLDVANEAAEPWYRTVTRWGQVNITEKDPPQYDIDWWRGYWKRTETKGVVVNAGGIVAYYPSKIPLHRHAQYLGGRDLFGEICKAAHDDGVAVFARMDSNRAHEEFYQAHPDWFAVDIDGKPYKAGDLYISCVNSPYYNEHIPSIIREISQLYKPEGFTDNSWSGLSRGSICYCNNCAKSFQEKTGNELPRAKNWNDKAYREWIKWNYARRLEIWDLNNRASKSAGGENCIWVGMNSGSVHGQSNYFRDFKSICERSEMIMLDDQARSNAEGFQHNGEIGKLLHGMLGWDKLIPESMSMYQTGGGVNFRLAAKSAPEARMWMINGIAGGIQTWWHHVGAYHEDRRAYKTAAPVTTWQKANEAYLIRREPIATIGVVWSQQNMDFYGRDNADNLVQLPWRGITQALIRARIPYLPVHVDHIARDADKFKLLILPNLASVSDTQVDAIKKFAEKGGSVIATGETSLYDEWGDRRKDFALSDVFGANFLHEDRDESLPKLAGNAYHTYLRLSPELRAQVDGPKNGKEPAVTGTRHAVLKGFEETDILPFGGLLQPLRVNGGAEVPFTFIPQFPVYPPETAWMREPSTDIPGLILKTTASGARVAFMPADIDRQFAVNNLPDHGNLLNNIVRWAVNSDIPLQVDGAGMVDCHLYKQNNRFVFQIVNLTSTATWRQPLDEFIPVGPLNIKIKLPSGITPKDIRLSVSRQKVNWGTANGWVHFEIKSLVDHELAVIL